MFKRKKQIEINNLEEQEKTTISDVKPKKSKKVKILIFGTIIFALNLLISFTSGEIFAGFIALLQFALCAATLLIKGGKIKALKPSFKKYYKVMPIIALALIIPFSIAFFADNSKVESINWTDIVLNEMLPKPKSNSAEIVTNDNDNLLIYIHKTSLEDYNEYVLSCEQMGFTVEADKTSSTYEAYGSEGYRLELYFSADKNIMKIDLEKPMELNNIKWPSIGLGQLLPAPQASIGKIEADNEKRFSAYVGDTSISDFNDYIDLCAQSGFNLERNKEEKRFTAKNSDDYSLLIEYKGNGLIYILLKEPEYNIQIKTNSIENIAFSTYDIKLYIDDSYEKILKNGDTDTFDAVLNKGTHTIKFVNAEDEAVSGQVDIVISKNETLEFKLASYSDKIDIEIISGTIDVKINSINITDLQPLTLYTDSSAKKISFKVETSEACSNPEELIEFVSENPEIASVQFDSSSSDYLYFIVTPITYGETNVYIQSKDKTVKSQIINVIVKEKETTTEATTKEAETKESATKAYDNDNDYEETKKNSRTVYVTPYGKKYHYSKSCAGKNAMERDLDDVKGAYGPCQKCVG